MEGERCLPTHLRSKQCGAGRLVRSGAQCGTSASGPPPAPPVATTCVVWSKTPQQNRDRDKLFERRWLHRSERIVAPGQSLAEPRTVYVYCLLSTAYCLLSTVSARTAAIPASMCWCDRCICAVMYLI
eukprot:SAG22_NODE_1666_length_3859_cov_292.311702_7_plen_128_part_00